MKPQPERNNMLTDQEIVDRVHAHFIRDENPLGYGPSVFSCSYRTEQGYCCAIGLFISDEDAHEWDMLDGTTISEVLIACRDSYLKYFTEEQEELLCVLQRWHDSQDVLSTGEERHETFTECINSWNALSGVSPLTVPNLN